MKTEILTMAFQRIRTRFRRGNDDRDSDSDDALQEAFCRLWDKHGEITDISHAEGLLVTASRNIRIDGLRRQQSHQSVSLSEISYLPWEEEDNTVAETYEQVTRLASRHLSDRDREILYLREKDGLEFSELAERYNLSEGNVRLIVSRARKALREIYRKECK